jgi:hypothetical protein
MYSICPIDLARQVVHSLRAPLINLPSSRVQDACVQASRTRPVQGEISTSCHHLTSEASSAMLTGFA